MTEKNKHHYRAVLKSDHLSIADLEDFIESKKPLIFTIKEVKQELDKAVAGKKGNFNIAYFNEPIKPLVLNATNAKTVRSFAKDRSPFVEDWNNIVVELFIDNNVKMKGEIVGGVRIKPVQPIRIKPTFTEAMFEKAKSAKATIESIEKNYKVSEETKLKYKDYAKD